jgi:hypothetical protein
MMVYAHKKRERGRENSGGKSSGRKPLIGFSDAVSLCVSSSQRAKRVAKL